MAKMRRSNSKARAFLKDLGFENIHLVPHTRWSKDINIDGAGFDGVCTRACRLYFIQIKTNSPASAKKYVSFTRIYGIPVLLLTAIDNEGVKGKAIDLDSLNNVVSVFDIGWGMGSCPRL